MSAILCRLLSKICDWRNCANRWKSHIFLAVSKIWSTSLCVHPSETCVDPVLSWSHSCPFGSRRLATTHFVSSERWLAGASRDTRPIYRNRSRHLFESRPTMGSWLPPITIFYCGWAWCWIRSIPTCSSGSGVFQTHIHRFHFNCYCYSKSETPGQLVIEYEFVNVRILVHESRSPSRLDRDQMSGQFRN